MSRLQGRRWFNPSLPQTLQIAVFLLYFNAFFAALDLLTIVLERWGPVGIVIKLVIAATIYLEIAGGLGVSEERKRGYRLALMAAFAPFAIRFLLGMRQLLDSTAQLIGYDLGDVIKDTLVGANVIQLIFEVALVALLLHPQSRDHERMWFQ